MTNLITLISLFVTLIKEDNIFTSVYDDAQTFSVTRLTQILDLIVQYNATPKECQKAHTVMKWTLVNRVGKATLNPTWLVNSIADALNVSIHDKARSDESYNFYQYEDLSELIGNSQTGLRAFAYNYIYSGGRDTRHDSKWDLEMYTIPYITINILASLTRMPVTEMVDRINIFTQPYADRIAGQSITADHSYANVTSRVMILLEVLASWCNS